MATAIQEAVIEAVLRAKANETILIPVAAANRIAAEHGNADHEQVYQVARLVIAEAIRVGVAMEDRKRAAL